MTYEELKPRLAQSAFRSRFRLTERDRAILAEKGWSVIRAQAEHIIRTRLASARPENDGKQTPMRGFPVFTAQHATGICCRSCLEKWHHIPQGIPLTGEQIGELAELLVAWMKDHAGDLSSFARTPDLFGDMLPEHNGNKLLNSRRHDNEQQISS